MKARKVMSITIPIVLVALVLAFLLVRPHGVRAPQIVVVLPTSDNPYWQDVQRGAKEEAAILNDSALVSVLAGKSDIDAEFQVQAMETRLETAMVNALVLGPASSTAPVPEVAQYNKRGIPVVVIDSRLDSVELVRQRAHVDVFIGSKNRNGGYLAAARIREQIGTGPRRVVLVEGSPVHETARERAAGFTEVADSAGWQVVRIGGEWDRAKAARLMSGQLQRGVPDAVFASSDKMAMGVIDALLDRRVPLSRWPVIVGFDATIDGLRAVQDGRMCATVAQQPTEMGKRAVQLAYELARHTGNPMTVDSIDVRLVPDSAGPCTGRK